MATYLQGVTDYIPQIQPFTPDYNFYSKVLDFKQSQQDSARTQLSSLYGSLLNAPLTRDDNSETRDKFFKTIQQDIKKMSGMDLTLKQNVNAAKGIFNQMLDNKNIRKDMIWTKNMYNEYKRANSFKNCIDPEKCGGAWWQGGERLMGYQVEAFKNATAEDALNMNNVKFTPYQDVTKKAMALAKEADLNVTQDIVSGQWIFTQKNGTLIEKDLQDLFSGIIGKDPKVMEYYVAKNEVSRRDFIRSNKDIYGSEQAAEQQYIQQYMPLMEKLYGETDKIEDKVNRTEAKIKKTEDKINTAGPEDKTRLMQQRDEYMQSGQMYQASLEKAKNTEGQVTVAQNNKQFTGAQIDLVLAGIDLNNDITKSAIVMSKRNASLSRKVNPYSLEKLKFDNRMLLDRQKHAYRLDEIDRKYLLENQKTVNAVGNAIGDSSGNIPTLNPNIPGNSTMGTTDLESREYLNRVADDYLNARKQQRVDLSANEKYIISEALTRTKMAAENGDPDAMEDFVRLNESLINTVDSDVMSLDYNEDNEQVIKPVEAYADLKKKLNNANTIQEKYDILKTNKIDLSKATGSKVDSAYTMLENIMNPGQNNNDLNRDYLSTLWEKSIDQRRNIAAKSEILSQMTEFYAESKNKIVEESRIKFGDKWAKAFDAYINEDGNIITQDMFVKKLKNTTYLDDEGNKQLFTEDELIGLYTGQQKDSPGVWSTTWRTLVSAPVVGAWGAYYGFTHDSKAVQNIHDMYKQAFTDVIKPTNSNSWYQLTGAGDRAAVGGTLEVDPSAQGSLATTGFISFIDEALQSENAVFSFGGFSEELPESNEKAKTVLQYALNDVKHMTNPKLKTIPRFLITYSDIAVSDKNKVGLNIKVNPQWASLYKGTSKEPMTLRDEENQEMTVYLDKNTTNNIFTKGAQSTAAEQLMQFREQIDYDMYPHEVKHAVLKKDTQSGQYIFTASIIEGYDENGKAIWGSKVIREPLSKNLNAVMTDLDNALATYVKDVRLLKQQTILNLKK